MAGAQSVRIATFDTELARGGPGLLLRDILRGDDQVAAVAGIVAHVSPDVLVLQGVDWDLDGRALAALADLLDYPYRFSARPNTGMATGRDMDGDGRDGRARDAQGYGRFAGEGGMALLSRWPIGGVRDFSALPWADLPGADPPVRNGAPFPDAERFAAQRLSTTAHWDVTVDLPGGPLHLLTWHATPPVFDGPEDRNGRRNRDEAAFWLRYLDGDLADAPPDGPLVVLGGTNLDPADGDGRPDAILALMAHPRLQDPAPKSAGAVAAVRAQGGANAAQTGDPALDTADWDDDGAGPGNLSVDRILPSRDLAVTGAGVFWPAPEDPLATLLVHNGTPASRHRLVWVDVRLP